MLAALAASFRRLLTILDEVAGIMFGATATMACLAAFAPGLRCPLGIVSKIARTVLTAGMASTRRLFTILCEVAGVVVRATATMARLPAFAPGLRRPFGVVREIAGAVLSAGMARPRRLLPILGKIARISGMSLFCHLRLPLQRLITNEPVLPAAASTVSANAGCVHKVSDLAC
jgi:hypothetical protein